MIRALLRRLRQSSSGYTLVEVIASVVILGIIMVPLGTAMVVGYRTVFGIQERLANSADVQRLSTYFPSDVASVDSDGVNPVRTEDEGICKATPTEESLITFRWDADLGDNGQTVVRYLGRGSGSTSEVVRRICRGSDLPVETVLAKNFGEKDGPEASQYLVTDQDGEDVQTPVCGTRQCSITISGKYDFHLDAQRRVEGDSGSNNPPGAPTNVHALGGFNRARVFWDDPLDTSGLPITGYYIEQTPGGIVGGASPVFYTPGSGTTGALVAPLTNNQSFTFRVRAVTIVGNGPWSASSNAVTPGPTTPEPPALATAVGDPNTDGRLTASWTLPSDYSDGGSALTGFNLIALNPDAIATTVPYMNGATRNGEVTGLANNTKYKVQVTAMNSYGEGSPSPVPINALTRPGKTGTPTAGNTGVAGSVTLTFILPAGGEVSDLTNVRAKVGSTFTTPVDVPTACPDSQSCTITVTGVNVSSSTNVTVQTQNATGWGAESDVLVIPADTTPPTVAFTFPSNPNYGTAGWNAGCNAAGGAICGSAADNFPGGVASVTLTVRRSGDNRYWNGNPGTSNSSGQPWNSSSPVNLTATGTTDWSRALTTASLQNGITYTITAVAKDTVNLSSTTVTKTFAYVTGAPTAALTAPANGAKVQGAAVVVSGTASATSPATVGSVDFQYKPTAGSTWTTIATDLTSPYDTTWDTTALAEGSYDLRIFVSDSALNTGTSLTRTVTVDNTPPTGSITSPANGAWVRGTISVTSNSADAGSGVASAQFRYKPTSGITWTNIGAADTTSPYSASWNTTALTDDSYDLQVITTDNVGFQTPSLVISVGVDNTNPVVGPANVVGSLGNNGWYTSDVAVTWPAPSDAGSGIASSTGCTPTNITSNTTGTTLTCSATDNAGNTASSQVVVKRDANAPTGNLTAPNNGSTVAGTVSVTSNSADTGGSGVANATFQYSPAGANTWTQIGAPDTTASYGVSWDTSALTQGSYDLRVITTDNAGLTFTSPVRTVFVDSVKPSVAISFPDDGDSYNAAKFNATCASGVCGTAADTAPGTVASVTMTIMRSGSPNRYWNGTVGTSTSQWLTTPTNLPATGTTSWTRAFTTASLSDGLTYTIVATATDSAGLSSDPATAAFKYDTTNPSGNVTAPANGANIDDTLNVVSSSADSFSGVASAKFEYRVNTSGAWTTIGTAVSSPWQVAWDTTTVPDGLYYLRVTTTDNAGNTFSSNDTAVRPRVDNTLPTGAITAPSNGANVRGSSVAVTSNSADSGSGVASALFERSPASTSTWTSIGTDSNSSGGWTVNWNTTSGTPDGLYDLRVTTTDLAGNSFTSPTITIRVDNTAPTVGPANVVGTLGDNGWYTSDVAVTWPAPSDAGSGIASSTGCGPTSITAFTSGQTLTCSATDNAGNSASSQVIVKMDKTAPTGALVLPNNGSTVAGTVSVTSNSADTGGSGVANATFQYSPAGANAWTQIGAPDTTASYGVSWDTSALTQVSYDLRVITTDNAGLTFTSPVRTVFVDSVKPSVAISFPDDGDSYNAAKFNATCASGVCGTAADTAPGTVASVTMTIMRSGSPNRYWNGTAGTSTSQWLTTPTNLPATGTTSWTRAFTTASLSDGLTYTIVATATDSAGLSSDPATAAFKYDTTNPSGNVTAPANGANIDDTLNVVSSSADSFSGVASAKFEYRVNTSGAWTTIGTAVSSPWQVAWDTTTVPDGLYYLRVTTTDNAGNTFSSNDTAVRPRVDNTLPTGAITAPSNGANVRGSSVAVTSNSADSGSGVASALFERSPASTSTWTSIGTDSNSSGGWTVNWNTTSGTPDGLYDLRVTTTDLAGNSFTSPTITIRVDNTAPTALANVTGTVVNGWYTTNAVLTWTITETGSGIASQTGCVNQTVSTDTTGTTFTCTVTDNAGNSSGTMSTTIKRDTVNPTGSLTAPANGATVGGTSVTVSSDSADATSGVASADFQRSPTGANTWTSIATDTSSPFSTNWNPTGLANGSYDLRVVTIDNAGHTFTSPIRTVTVDVTKPTPTNVVMVNNGGSGGLGRIDNGDAIVFTYSDVLSVSTICTGWTGTGNKTTTANVRVTTGDDLEVTSVCTNIGTTDLVRNYNSSSLSARTYNGSTIAWNEAAKTITITFANGSSGSAGTGNSAANPVYTPTTGLTDALGNAMNATAFTAPGASQF